MTRWLRILGPLALMIGLVLMPALVAAQAVDPYAPVPGEADSQGNPIYGYMVAALFACAAIFVLCKSARR